MDFSIEPHLDESNNCWKVILSGEIDIFSSADVKTQLTQLMEEKAADMRVDCKQLEYIDSTGLGALVGVLKNVKGHGKTLYLSSVKPNILKLFRITNLDKVFVLEEGAEDGANDE